MKRIESRNSALPALAGRAGTILVIGMVAATAGLIFFCNVAILTITSWAMIGVILCTSGFFQSLAGLQLAGPRNWPTWLFVMAFYWVFGILCFTNPSPRLAFLSLIFYIGLMAIGIIRISCGHHLRRVAGRVWLLAGGLYLFCTAMYLAAHWPMNGRSLAAMLLAADLTIYGMTIAAFAYRLGKGPADRRIS